MSQVYNLTLVALQGLNRYQVARVTPSNDKVAFGPRRYDASNRLSLERQVNFEGNRVPKLQGAVIRHGHKLLLAQFNHLVDARQVLFDALDRLDQDARVGVLDVEALIFLDRSVSLSHEVN